jgi:hypothetical protein
MLMGTAFVIGKNYIFSCTQSISFRYQQVPSKYVLREMIRLLVHHPPITAGDGTVNRKL